MNDVISLRVAFSMDRDINADTHIIVHVRIFQVRPSCEALWVVVN